MQISTRSFVRILKKHDSLGNFSAQLNGLSVLKSNKGNSYAFFGNFEIHPDAAANVLYTTPENAKKFDDLKAIVEKVVCTVESTFFPDNDTRGKISTSLLIKAIESNPEIRVSATFKQDFSPLIETQSGIGTANYSQTREADESYSELSSLLRKMVSSPTNSLSETQLEELSETQLEEMDIEPVQIPKSSFREFLISEGLMGFPADLDRTLEPIFARFGELAPYAKARGIQGEKGILLYGPPGTGKTSIARAVAKYLNCPEERISIGIGPTLLGRYVGETEANIRSLFIPCSKALCKWGEKSPLFVVIIDEIDAIARNRKYANHSFESSQVNQLLSCMDGMFQRPNVLVIGMTNLREQIDPALLRHGRFGAQIKIDIPDRKTRKEIFEVYLKSLREQNLLAPDIDLEALCDRTEGYSGADLKGLVEKVNDCSFHRLIGRYRRGECTLEQVPTEPTGIVTKRDFEEALNAMPPQLPTESAEPATLRDLKEVLRTMPPQLQLVEPNHAPELMAE